MNPIYLTIIVVLVALTFFIQFYSQYKRKKMIDKLTPLAISRHTQEFDRLIDQEETIRTIPEYNRTILKLNSYLFRNDQEKIEKLFLEANNAHFNERQKLDFYVRELMYYIDHSNKIKAKEIYAKLEKNRNFSKIRGEVELPYKILVLDETDKLDQLIEKSKHVDDPKNRAAYYMLISHIYETLKDKKQAKDYQEKAKSLLERR